MIKRVKFSYVDMVTGEEGIYIGHFATTAEVLDFINRNYNPEPWEGLNPMWMVPLSWGWVDAQAFDFDNWEEL